jgi:hypothetical protein
MAGPALRACPGEEQRHGRTAPKKKGCSLSFFVPPAFHQLAGVIFSMDGRRFHDVVHAHDSVHAVSLWKRRCGRIGPLRHGA